MPDDTQTKHPQDQGIIDTGDSAGPKDPNPAEERGERVETGRHIARGGKQGGEVRGATGDAGDPRDGSDGV